MKKGLLATNGDPVAAVRGFLKSLITMKAVDSVMAPALQESGSASLALFADPEETGALLPFAPVMPVQAARMASRLAFNDPGATMAVLVRPCEARAAVELIKLQQIKPEKLIFISIDCPGTFETAGFAKAGLDAASEAARMSGEMGKGAVSAASVPFRVSCTICENPAAKWGGIRIQAFGAKTGEALGVEAEDEIAELLASKGVFSFDGKTVETRDQAVKALEAERAKARDALFASFEKEAAGLDGLKKAFSTCIKCLNCMENCPICYCKLCIFKSTTFDHPAERYPRWAARKGVQKMPAETTLFHLTRLNHMASSCIGCGICDTACPMGLPVATLFRKVASKVQGMLEYSAGRSTDDPIPLSKFREDELRAESGAKD